MLPAHWPKWTVIFIALALAVFSILLALVLEPAARALMPQPTPTATLSTLIYAAPQSWECIFCHTSLEALRQTVSDWAELERLWIDPVYVHSTHGRLGCVTCHQGTGGTKDLAVAHQGLVKDPTLHFEGKCLPCHRDLPDEILRTRLRAPHSSVVHGLAQDLTCSDCHGRVGHGFDPVTGKVICSMSACIDCHRIRNLSEDCHVCHIGPHDVAGVIACNVCHVSIERWHRIRLADHPGVELVGGHAPIDCFDCHNWPNFGGLRYVCSDCHQRPHDFGDDNCERCHIPEGWNQWGQ
jgi:hypothetical protein